MGKYRKLDRQVLEWLSRHRTNITTARIWRALEITIPAQQRYISRKFTSLENQGFLSCTLRRTTRVCSVVKPLPKTLGPKPKEREIHIPVAIAVSIPANNSFEFEAAGGKIQRLVSDWNHRRSRTPLGRVTFLEQLAELD